MNAEWQTVALADVCVDISYGYTESAQYAPVGPRFLRITDIQNGVVDWSTVPYCIINDRKLPNYLLKHGDIVIARTGNSTGENYIYDSSEAAVFASYLIRYRIDDTKVNPFFVWYQLRTNKWWDFVAGSKTGSAQAGANAQVLGKFKIVVPPRDVQDRIAVQLKAIDTKNDLNCRINKTLEAIAQAIFKSWFVDFDPVKAKIAAIAEGRDPLRAAISVISGKPDAELDALPPEQYEQLAATAALFPNEMEESGLGAVPRGWKVSDMRSIAEVISKGTTPNKLDLANAEDKPAIPFIKVKDILGSGEVNRGGLELIAKSIHDSSLKRSILKEDDLLFSIAGTIGRTAFVDSDLHGANANQAVAFIRLRNKRSHFPLCWLALRSCETQNFIASKVVQAVQANASLAKIGDIPVILPSDDVLGRFNLLVIPLIREYRARQSETRVLASARDTLLPKLLSGELSIEALAEQAGIA